MSYGSVSVFQMNDKVLNKSSVLYYLRTIVELDSSKYFMIFKITWQLVWNAIRVQVLKFSSSVSRFAIRIILESIKKAAWEELTR